jgi:hypothetical protein
MDQRHVTEAPDRHLHRRKRLHAGHRMRGSGEQRALVVERAVAEHDQVFRRQVRVVPADVRIEESLDVARVQLLQDLLVAARRIFALPARMSRCALADQR